MSEKTIPDKLLNRKWFIVVTALVCAIPLWFWRGRPGGMGSTIEVKLTLVSSDKDDLACGASAEYAGFRCRFAPTGEPIVPEPQPDKTLAPYMNHERRLFLIPNLFASEPLRARYEADSSKRIPRNKRKRFDAVCQLRLVQKVDGVSVSWLRSHKVSGNEVAWVATPERCTIEGS